MGFIWQVGLPSLDVEAVGQRVVVDALNLWIRGRKFKKINSFQIIASHP